MRTIQAWDVKCERCVRVALFRTLHDIEKGGWVLDADQNGRLCPNCAAEEKPDITSEVVELKARIEKLENTLRDVRAMRDKTQDILNKVTCAIGWQRG